MTYKNWKEKRYYETGANKEPGSWMYLEHPTHSDWYSLSTMLDFIDAAEKNNINPIDYVALGISESGLGNQDYTNPVRVSWKSHPDFTEKIGKVPYDPEKKRAAV